MKNTWYEIFATKPSGETETIESCDTLIEARKIKESLSKEENIHVGHTLSKREELTLHIDEWENPDNPLSLGSIE